MRLIALSAVVSLLVAAPVQALPLERLQLEPGYQIQLAAKVKNARQMALAEDGTLFVGSRREGKVYRLRDLNQDGYYEQRHVVGLNLDMPTGIAYHQGKLYIAALNQILRLDNPLTKQTGPLRVLTNTLPTARHHGWKYLKVGPDQQLYFNVGAPCNVCLEEDPRFATLMRMPLSGGSPEIIAQGVRNSVGFDWHPNDSALWFTDNGRDWLGDDQPDDEVNRLARIGQHFGFPFVHGQAAADPDYADRKPPQLDTEAPILGLQAHTAPLGMTFSQDKRWAKANTTSLFIAQHGSWNRSEKVGYQILKVRLQGNEVIDAKPFIRGWLNHGSSWGRPVDVLFSTDGSLLISDDYAHAVYRVTATPE